MLKLYLNEESFPAISSFLIATIHLSQNYAFATTGYPKLTILPLITSGYFPNVVVSAQYSMKTFPVGWVGWWGKLELKLNSAQLGLEAWAEIANILNNLCKNKLKFD